MQLDDNIEERADTLSLTEWTSPAPAGQSTAPKQSKLRAVRSNGDFDDYWTFHLDHERQRVHQSCYAGGIIPLAA